MKSSSLPRRLCGAIVCIGFLAWGASASALEELSVQEAYEHLISPASTYPNDFTERDLEAIAVFRNHPEEAKALLVAKFLSGERKEEGMGKYLNIFSPEQKRDLIQEILRHYPPGTLGTPFTGYLAYFGDAKDMERLKAIFALRPDAEGTRRVATLMAESDNAHAHAALLELKDTAPGKWQESPDVKKLFAKTASTQPSSTTSATESQTAAPSSPKELGEQSKPSQMAANPAPANGTTQDAESSAGFLRWSWALGAALVVLGLVFFWAKRRGNSS